MNRLSKKWIRVMAISAMCAVSLLQANRSFAQDRQEHGKKHEEIFENIIKELNLSPEQQQRIAAQKAKEKEGSAVLREQMKNLRDELGKELEKEVTDKGKVDALVAQMKELTGKRMENKIEGILSLKEILTPEQFKALNEKTRKSEGEKRRRP
jgi:Spy/CpxP family protein refolding chaperone